MEIMFRILVLIKLSENSTDSDGLFTNKDATSLSGSLTLDGILSNSKILMVILP